MDREDRHVVKALCELCHEYKVTCILQVGAGDGYEADEVRKYTGCRAVAIEGCSDAPRVFSETDWHIAVIGATDGPAPFYVHTNNRNLSSPISRENNEIKTTVEQRRLDTFCREHELQPDALIIDTEGTTLDVLEGCGDLLNNVNVIYAECQTTILRPGMRLFGEIDKYLRPYGFSYSAKPPSYDGGSQGNFTWVRDDKKSDIS